MTEYNDKEDRVPANNWFGTNDALAELDRLRFAFASLVSMCGTPGSHERELAELASLGFRRRVDYLHDSLRRRLNPKTPNVL